MVMWDVGRGTWGTISRHPSPVTRHPRPTSHVYPLLTSGAGIEVRVSSQKSQAEPARPVAGKLKGHAAMLARYGTTRSFTMRTLYTWLTLTMLYLFTWPLLVLLTAAPGVT